MYSNTLSPEVNPPDEIAGLFYQSPTQPEEQIHQRPFSGQSYMEERDPQFLSTNAFLFQPIFKEGLDNQQPENENELKTEMEIEKSEVQNPKKEEIKISQSSPETQAATASTNQSTPETQQTKHATIPTFPDLNAQRKVMTENYLTSLK